MTLQTCLGFERATNNEVEQDERFQLFEFNTIATLCAPFHFCVFLTLCGLLVGFKVFYIYK